MEDLNMLNEDIKWQAVEQCSREYDGLFFYGVKTTGIFCRPSCRSREPKRGNVVFFDSASEAVSAGFRPCKRCRPDLLEYEPDDELIRKIKDIIDVHYSDRERIGIELKGLGMSSNRLSELFRIKCGLTPSKYAGKVRVAKAAELLAVSDRSITEIALLSGFQSISSFYELFRKEKGMTPQEYRKKTTS
jgi:AraC family transcriptional regulator of adaptative response / methylphosphotriester-DNA alkyltransferase methyltransferase